MTYPTFEDLHIAPDFLLIGAVAMRELRRYGYLAPTVRESPEAERRAYGRTTRKNWAGRQGSG